MTTMTDFLLARIDEAEAPTWELVPYDCPPGCCAPEGWVGHRCLICDVHVVSYGGTAEAIGEIARDHAEDIHQRSRVLARCAVDRRIVDECAKFREVADATAADAPLPQALAQAGVVQGLERAVAHLASVYVDHPDYQPEWKP